MASSISAAQSGSEQLDVDGLDEEDLKVLAEVSAKGYYHGRPKSEAAPPPSRLADACGPQRIDPDVAPSTVRRAEFDEFQRKWDRFDKDEPTTSERDPGAPSIVPKPSQAAPQTVPDESVVAQLVSMGFGEQESRAAAVATKNQTDAAVEYILGGGVSATERSPAGPATRRGEADAENLAMMLDMGINERFAREALESCGNNLELAIDRAMQRASEEDPSVKLQAARDTLSQLEAGVGLLENNSAPPDAKRLKYLEEELTQMSCRLDSLDVGSSGDAIRDQRRVELDRCNVLDTRVMALKTRENRNPCPATAARPMDSCSVSADNHTAPAGVVDGSTAAESDAATGGTNLPTTSQAQDCINDAVSLRLSGNEAFKAGDYATAAQHYRSALALDAENVAILSNLAASELKLGDFHQAASHADAANVLSGGYSAKALFRKGQALEGLDRPDDAYEAYHAALQVEPNDKTVRQRLQACRRAADGCEK